MFTRVTNANPLVLAGARALHLIASSDGRGIATTVHTNGGSALLSATAGAAADDAAAVLIYLCEFAVCCCAKRRARFRQMDRQPDGPNRAHSWSDGGNVRFHRGAVWGFH